MSETREIGSRSWIPLIALVIAIIILLFGDNLVQQLTGCSIGDFLRQSCSAPEPSPSSSPAPNAGNLKIVSSLPMTGNDFGQTLVTQAFANAMRLRLEQANYRACGGTYTIEYESWDDASVALGDWDPTVEASNAEKAANDEKIIAYLGTWNSAAARISIPILNNAGPLVMISPGNTRPGLTKPGTGDSDEPYKYYPTGIRNYTRVSIADDVQGEVAARFVKEYLSGRTVYILEDQTLYGKALASAFQRTASQIGLTIIGHDQIDSTASSYISLMQKINISNNGNPPDVIYASLLIDSNAAQLLKDKVSIMGDNSIVKFVGPDGIQDKTLIDVAGANIAQGVYTSFTFLPSDYLSESGKAFYQDYIAKFGQTGELWAAYGYEAMSVALTAIEDVCANNGDPTDRRAIRDAVFAIRNFAGVLGNWSFDENGDTTLSSMVFYEVKNGSFEPIGLFK